MKQKNLLTLNFVCLCLVIYLFISLPITFTPDSTVQAMNFGLEARGSFTTFADEDVLQREIILEAENQENEEKLNLDITRAQGFALAGNLQVQPGLNFIADFSLFSTSDSDRMKVDGSTENASASMLLASLGLSGELNLAEFTEMYDIPSILLTAGTGYYHAYGEIDSSSQDFTTENLEGGNFGFKVGTGIRQDISENLVVKGNISYRSLTIPLEQHTDLNGPQVSGSLTYIF